MKTTYHNLFDTTHEEADAIVTKLKYLDGQANINIVIDCLFESTLELRRAFWSALYRHQNQNNGVEYPEYFWHLDEDHEDHKYEPFRNDLLVRNFAEDFGWDKNDLLDNIRLL